MGNRILVVVDAKMPSFALLDEGWGLARHEPGAELHVVAFGREDAQVRTALAFLAASSIERPPVTHIHLVPGAPGRARVLRLAAETDANHLVFGDESFGFGPSSTVVARRLMREAPCVVTYVLGQGRDRGPS